MTELQHLYDRRHRNTWRFWYRKVRRDPAFYAYDRDANQRRHVMAALYALGFRESPRALHQSARYGGFWPGMVP